MSERKIGGSLGFKLFGPKRIVCSILFFMHKTSNLSFGFFHPKKGNFSVKFRRFAFENNHLAIPFEQILRTMPRALAYFRSDKIQNSG
jgi:hypothetical protein